MLRSSKLATHTAPLFTAAATYKRVSIRWIDASGDLWAGSALVPTATTAALLDTMLGDIREKTNASNYETELTEVRTGARSKANATTDPRSQSVYDHVFITFKNAATGASQRIYIPAPLELTLVPDTDTPDLAALADLSLSSLAVLGAGYAARSARYTEMREINEAEEF